MEIDCDCDNLTVDANKIFYEIMLKNIIANAIKYGMFVKIKIPHAQPSQPIWVWVDIMFQLFSITKESEN